jgi:hypothetical protein
MNNMGLRWHCNWLFKCVKDGRILWENSVNNILVTEGGKAITDSFLRANDATYFAATNFWVGLYRGSISKSTVLATVPGEPSGNGYSRNVIERSSVGWPTFEIDDDGDWRLTSKEITIQASGGDIGPVDGGFLGTSSDNSGYLIGAVATGVQRTIWAGASLIVQLRAKVK